DRGHAGSGVAGRRGHGQEQQRERRREESGSGHGQVRPAYAFERSRTSVRSSDARSATRALSGSGSSRTASPRWRQISVVRYSGSLYETVATAAPSASSAVSGRRSSSQRATRGENQTDAVPTWPDSSSAPARSARPGRRSKVVSSISAERMRSTRNVRSPSLV